MHRKRFTKMFSASWIRGAAAAGLVLSAAALSPGLASAEGWGYGDGQLVTRCDSDGDRCAVFRCDRDGDDCEQASPWRRVDDGDGWGRRYGDQRIETRCDSDGDRCASYRCDWDGDRCVRISGWWRGD